VSAVLQTRGITKSFGGVRAVRGVDFEMQEGEIHALLGENGAGKSTFVGMLSGILRPDEGQILMGGEAVALASPQEAQNLGIRTVHQELELAGSLSVAENVLLGRLPSRFGHIDRVAIRRRALAVLNRLGGGLDVDTPVEQLSVADQQITEIARAIAAEPRVLFLDEPTAALAPPEIERLIEVLMSLRSEGVAILYISHRLDEVLRISDRITVLRDGAVAFSEVNDSLRREDVVTAMLGAELAAAASVDAVITKDISIEVTGLQTGQVVEDASFIAGRGEIVGFFGLTGSGQMDIADALFGVAKATVREVRLLGDSTLPRSPREAIDRGFAFVPADRKRSGLALGLSIGDNLLMTALRGLSRFGVRNSRAESELIDRLVDRYRIKSSSPKALASSLSGGNQQKVVLGRSTATGRTQALLLCEPTRGVDVGAKAEIYRFLRAFAADGATCLLFSSDAEEVAAVCDRAYVVARGRIVSEHRRGEFTAAGLTAKAL
jgi:rhamnose transport system ATP-binding protein